jgi:hypothetical protein
MSKQKWAMIKPGTVIENGYSTKRIDDTEYMK